MEREQDAPIATSTTEPEEEHVDVLQELLEELRSQHATLSSFTAPSTERKILDRIGFIFRTAAGVALGLTAFWGLVQATGQANLAVPVKFFVPAEQLQTDVESGSDPDLDDGYCPDGESYSDNFDPDC